MVKSFQKADHMAVKTLAKQSKMSQLQNSLKSMIPESLKDQCMQKLQVVEKKLSGEDEEPDQAFADEMNAEDIRMDFIARDPSKNGRREFLLDFCKEEGLRNFKTQRALDRGSYLPDETILEMKSKVKPPTANSLRVDKMQSSAVNMLDQSQNS